MAELSVQRNCLALGAKFIIRHLFFSFQNISLSRAFKPGSNVLSRAPLAPPLAAGTLDGAF
jgi:hypothetical protein